MKIFCVGRNYAAHAKELGNATPDAPVIFMKPATALLKEKYFFIPDFSNNIHFETEIVLKIGKNGKAIQPQFASRYISEISLGIDFTARDKQDELKQKGLPWELAKAFDNSAVVGNFIPTTSFNDIQNIDFHLLVNGEKRQFGNSSNTIFDFNFIVYYISQFFTLQQGDLIYTGTPEGVGQIKTGDVLEGFLENKKMFEVEIK
jgi:2-keto-4-pentenoate hydratase/2-oxohepta-3-ene-1,7-dioic acid hydratase in catechol pathway